MHFFTSTNKKMTPTTFPFFHQTNLLLRDADSNFHRGNNIVRDQKRANIMAGRYYILNVLDIMKNTTM